MFMKTMASIMSSFLTSLPAKRNIKILLRFVLMLSLLVLVYSFAFHLLMQYEGRQFSWITGIYWTLTVMSTLGFGDITFHSDLGLLFSIIVLMSGLVLLLALLPFTFIKFFYEPFMAAQTASQAPRELPKQTENHVIIVGFDPVAKALIGKLDQYSIEYVVLVNNLEEALKLHDLGVRVARGDFDDPSTYKLMRIDKAALVVAALSDVVNTNVTFTVREIAKYVPIIVTATSEASVDILKLAGANHVIQMGSLLGQFLARRVVGGDAKTHVVGSFGELLIAEAGVANTPLVGKTVGETRLRERLGVNIVGVWERGQFLNAGPKTPLTKSSIVILAGTEEQLRAYDKEYNVFNTSEAPVVIIGGGRVGRAVGKALQAVGRDYRIVEKLPGRVRDKAHYILGDAAEIEVLEEAGINQSPSVLVTTHDDDINIYLTLYCRRLRPDMQVISRATFERNISTLHRAGADFVMSYASMGANTIFNLLRRNDILLIAEGLDVFRLRLPKALVNKTIKETDIRRATGCTIIAIRNANGETTINPDPSLVMLTGSELILIGSAEAEDKFLRQF